jgi:hypothetical protein
MFWLAWHSLSKVRSDAEMASVGGGDDDDDEGVVL